LQNWKVQAKSAQRRCRSGGSRSLEWQLPDLSDPTKVLMRLGKFNIFWVGQGNDALRAPHHTRVEGDQRHANPMGMLGTGCRSFENKRARDIGWI
jgi:hypothetical protein